MRLQSKITTKGRTTIPAEVRQYLKLGAGDRIGYELADGKVTIVARKKSADFAGALYQPGREPVRVEAMKLAIREDVAERYERSRERD